MLEIVMPKRSCWGANKWGTLVERRTPGRRTFAEAGDDAARNNYILHGCKRPLRCSSARVLRAAARKVYVEATWSSRRARTEVLCSDQIAASNRSPSFNIGLGTKDLATRMSVGRVVSIPVGRRERTHMAIAGPTRFWHCAFDARERVVIKIVLGALQGKCPPRARRWVVRRRPPVPTRLLPVEMTAAEGRQASI